MKLDYLNDFPKRMKKVGSYGLIFMNSMFKGTWKGYGFEESYESINLIYAVLMFIMEQSLKEEICTIDDIASYIDEINTRFFKKPLSYDQCRELADFIVNTVLCDEGKPMYFKGYDFKQGEYKNISISYVNNRTTYVNENVKRVTYYLTDDGYQLLLGTLEMESNMKLTVYEMIFKLQLEKTDYAGAVDMIKSIFNESRRQLQRMEEGIRRIKENVLTFSGEEYEKILNDNMEIISSQKMKFGIYKQKVNSKMEELQKKGIDIEKLNDEEKDNLDNLGIINEYLSKVIGDQQRILNTHFDFKIAYSQALEGMTTMASIKRISFRDEIMDKILSDSRCIEAMDRIFRPLYLSKPVKRYNLAKCLQYQRVVKTVEDETEEEIALDEESYRLEKERERKRKQALYRGVLENVLLFVEGCQNKQCSLRDIAEAVFRGNLDQSSIIPSAEIFREVMIELLKSEHLDVKQLRSEAKNSIQEEVHDDFEVSAVFLEIMDTNPGLNKISGLEIYKIPEDEPVRLYGVPMDNGLVKTVTCSNIGFRCI